MGTSTALPQFPVLAPGTYFAGGVAQKVLIGVGVDIAIGLLTGGSIFAAIFFGWWDDLLVAIVGASLGTVDTIVLDVGLNELMRGYEELAEEADDDDQSVQDAFDSRFIAQNSKVWENGQLMPIPRMELGLTLGWAALQGYPQTAFEVALGAFDEYVVPVLAAGL